MRNRAITTQELHCSILAEISILANLLYHHLKVNSDDFGCVRAKTVAYIRNICFPMRNDITDKQVGEAIKELQKVGLILEITYLNDTHYFLPSFVSEQKINNPSTKRNITKQILTTIIVEKAKSLGENAPKPIQKLIHYYCQDYEFKTRNGSTKEMYFSESIDREIIISALEKDVKPRPKQAVPSKENRDKPQQKPQTKPESKNTPTPEVELPAYIKERRGEAIKAIVNDHLEKQSTNALPKKYSKSMIFDALHKGSKMQRLLLFAKNNYKIYDFSNEEMFMQYVANVMLDIFIEDKTLHNQCTFNNDEHVVNALVSWFESSGHKLVRKLNQKDVKARKG